MSVVPYDEQAVEAIASTLNLRAPNRDALDAIARELDVCEPGSELVADLATGVGKTYIAGGLLDYLYEQGVRNVVIVTPGSTIQRKTVANLKPGHPKYLHGLACDPLVITLDDFERGTVAVALDDPERFKVFVFTVQSLLSRNSNENRRAHRPHETLGQSLAEYLRAAEDLVVIADEHHVYFNRTANQFRAAISDLEPSVLIGLTATPHESTDPSHIVYRYPLAAAIADGYVKIPVLVARQDGKSDLRTQLADGLQLLAAKEAAMRAHVRLTREPYIQPLLFVVASTIDEANTIRDILASPDYLDGDDKVLLVTSDEPDTVTGQLDTLEAPDSPVQAVVNVAMLGIGWDIKNVYVIAAVRALESQLLTEQILGRGLRLPFGRLTGVTMLDTVEVLSHHAFTDLLRNARALLEQTLGERAHDATATTTDPAAPGRATATVDLDHDDLPTVDDGSSTSVTISLPAPPANTNPDQGQLFPDSTEDSEQHEVIGLSTLDARLTDAANTTTALTTPLTPTPPTGTRLPLYIPKVTYTWQRDRFSLASINTTDVEALGAQFADDNAPSLRRKLIDAERDNETGIVTVQISDANDNVTATQLAMPFDTIETDLIRRIMNSNGIEASVQEYNAAGGIARAFLTGAQVSEETSWSADHARLATQALTTWIDTRQTATPARLIPQVSQVRWPEPPEVTENQLPTDRHLIARSADFITGYPYTGWHKSFYTVASFHSYSAEFRLAELLDTTPGVKAWQRITSTVPLTIPYQAGAANRTYIPDFIVIDDQNIYWIVEAKADRDLTDPTVAAKRAAAHKWVDAVNAANNIPTRWAYLLVGETTISNAATWAALKTGGQAHG